MATEVGAAYVRLLPSMRGFTAAARTQLQSALQDAGRSAGDSGGEAASSGFMGKLSEKIGAGAGKLGKVLGKVAKVAGAAGTAAAGFIGMLGVKRLVGLENANKSFTQMGLKTKQIDGLMAGLLKTLRGTPYALNDGATAMASLVSAGAPLKKVNKYMDLIADSSAFAQKPMSEVARVFQKIQSQGRIQGDEIMSLAEMGLPAFQVLSAGMGKSVQDVQKQIKAGKFTADIFFDAWAKGSKGFGKENIKIAGAAKNTGDTTMGALSNVKAAFGRLGAMILGKPFASTKDFFNGITKLTDNATAKLAPLVKKFNDIAAAAGKKIKPIAINFISKGEDIAKGIDWAGITKSIQDKASAIGGPFVDSLGDGIGKGDWSKFGGSLGLGIGKALNSVVVTGIDWGGKVGSWVAGVDWFAFGRSAGKQAIGFVLGFTVGLLADTDWAGIGSTLWKNRGAVIMAALFILPIGKAFGLVGKGLAHIPVLKMFAPLFKGIETGATKLSGPLYRGIKAAGGAIFKGFAEIFPRAGAFLERFFARLGRNSADGMKQFGTVIMQGIGRGIAALGRGILKMVTVGSKLVFGLIRGVGKAALGIVSSIARLDIKILAGAVALPGLLYSFGVDMVQGFINGAVDRAKNLPSAIGGALKSGVETGLSWFGFGSPSKRMKTFGEWTTAGFVKGLKESTNGADVKSAFADLIEQAKKSGDSVILALSKKFQQKLIVKANARDDTLVALDKAKEKLQTLKDTAKDFRTAIKDSFAALGDVTQFETNNFAELSGYMKLAADKAATFDSVMKQLAAKGLNRTSIDQLLATGGSDEGLKTAQQILGAGQAGINQINGFMSSIKASGKDLSGTLSSQFYDAGIASAEGIINGLKAKKDKLDAAMTTLAKSLTAAIRRELGIKSPSRVFAGIGAMVPAGFAMGVDRGTPEAFASLSRMIALPENLRSPQLALAGSIGGGLPVTAGGVGGTASLAPVEVKVSGDGLNRKLLEWLRESVRVDGGNVQKFLGSGNN